MEAEEIVRALESSPAEIPDNAEVSILTPEAMVYKVVEVEYEAETNTVWLKVEEVE
jgi:hypothetical protein